MLPRLTQLIGNWRARRLVAGLVAVFALLIGSIAMTTPAMAYTVDTIQHSCEQIGTADKYGNTAVICTDLLGYDYGNGTWQIGARTEAICEDANDDVVQCANATVVNESVFSASNGPNDSVYFYDACGHTSPACPAGRFFVVNDNYLPNPGPVTCIANAWAVTNQENGPGGLLITSIQLPTSGKTIDLPADFATPHASVGEC
jgi:hypothetical protein